MVNALLLLGGEKLRAPWPPAAVRSDRDGRTHDRLWQCTALIPGISRSGATIVGGLLRGIDHEGSAHFSFLIATPIILGATVLEVPQLLHESVPVGTFELAAMAAVVAGITAFASTWFLMRYFRQHDAWALNPFAYYCLAVGVVQPAVCACRLTPAALASPPLAGGCRHVHGDGKARCAPAVAGTWRRGGRARPGTATGVRTARREVYDAFCRYQVLCFRDQRLSKDNRSLSPSSSARWSATLRVIAAPITRWCTRFPI